MISTVLFDMNDVLCRYDRNVRAKHLAVLCGKPRALVEAAIWESGYEDLGDCGVIDADAYLAGFGERLGYPLSLAEWAGVLRDAITPIPETLALAATVGGKARIALLTNNNFLVKRAIDAIFPELRPIFGPNIYVSAEFHARKPDPDAYLRCLAQLGAAPAATLFVDDSAKNVEGAERAGLSGHLYRNSAALADALRTAGLLK
jgi:putative hydrolase of the HAD superfamily